MGARRALFKKCKKAKNTKKHHLEALISVALRAPFLEKYLSVSYV
jgi:hypothetical protein